MRLRPEFELLDGYFRRLFNNIDIDRDFLETVRVHIRLCDHIAERGEEKSIIYRTTHWWRKKAAPFGMDMDLKAIPNTMAPVADTKSGDPPKVPYELTTQDVKFLRSMKVKAEKEGQPDPEDDLSPLI